MPSSKRDRELARQRAERQAARRAAAEAARKRRRAAIAAAVAGVVAVSAVAALLVSQRGDDSAAAPEASPPPSEVTVACGAKEPARVTPQQFPSEPPLTIDPAAKYVMKIKTSCGEVTADLLAAKAPRTVNSFAFLAERNYFDGAVCHRLTGPEGLSVLQCGDPTGSGSGTPGYKFPDENLKGATYPRGTLAMANSGPGTNGSQFFLVYKDSQLPPQYTPFGTITGGLEVLDEIAKLVPPEGDGAPTSPVFTEDVTVTKQ